MKYNIEAFIERQLRKEHDSIYRNFRGPCIAIGFGVIGTPRKVLEEREKEFHKCRDFDYWCKKEGLLNET